jgi:DTW domain-containing protein YfiP
MRDSSSDVRPICLRCLRPRAACFCQDLPRIPTRTELLILQHPRERRVAIGTVRLLAAGLANARVLQAVRADAELGPRLEEPGTALLFPGPSSLPPEALPALRRLVVVDGTWPQARKLVRLNPRLAALPRVGFVPRRPSSYRIRKEPAPHCLSTLEAVLEVLEALEGDPQRFLPLRQAFAAMVDHQLLCAARRVGPPRIRQRTGPPRPRIPRVLTEAGERLVLVWCEANGHPLVQGVWNPPELVHLCAVRPETAERFERVVRPRRRLAEAIPDYIGLGRDQLAAGNPVEEARRDFRTFLGSGSVVAGWGAFSARLLTEEGFLDAPPLDLRRLLIALERGPVGAVESRVPPGPALGLGRAGRRLGALARLLPVFLAPAPRAAVA